MGARSGGYQKTPIAPAFRANSKTPRRDDFLSVRNEDAMEALGAVGFLLLLAHAAAHVALVVAIARSKPARGVFAFFFPPAGVVWGWETGKKANVVAYGTTLVAFAVAVTAIVFVRG